MELRLFLSALARGWWILVSTVLIGLIGAGGHAALQQPQYQSSAKLLLHVVSATGVDQLTQANSLITQVIGNYAEIAGTPYVLDRAAERSSRGLSAGQLGGMVNVSVSGATAFLIVDASGSSADDAEDAATSVARSLIASSSDVVPETKGSGALELTLVQSASPAVQTVGGSPVTEALIGALIGLILGAAIVVLRERMHARFDSVSRIAGVTGATVIATIPDDRRARSTPVHLLRERSPARFEAFRSLRAAVEGIGLSPEGGVSIAVTSSIAGEGRSSVVAGLAVAIAATRRDVVVIEADAQRRGVARMLGVDAETGLNDVLTGVSDLEDVLVDGAEEHVRVLPAGTPVPIAGELVGSQAMSRVIESLTGSGAVVLIDTPPVLAMASVATIAQRTDHLLFVVGATRVREREAERATEVLRRVQVQVSGVVVNGVPRLWADSNVQAYSTYVARSAFKRR